jgi:hypothetical protein
LGPDELPISPTLPTISYASSHHLLLRAASHLGAEDSKLRTSSKLRKPTKIEEEVIGEQGLAALALGKFEEEYEIEEADEIEPMLPKTSLRKSLTTV